MVDKLTLFYDEEYHIERAKKYNKIKDDPLYKTLEEKYENVNEIEWKILTWIFYSLLIWGISDNGLILILAVMLWILSYYASHESKKILNAMKIVRGY